MALKRQLSLWENKFRVYSEHKVAAEPKIAFIWMVSVMSFGGHANKAKCYDIDFKLKFSIDFEFWISKWRWWLQQLRDSEVMPIKLWPNPEIEHDQSEKYDVNWASQKAAIQK